MGNPNCPYSCVETCVCPTGYLLDGNSCVLSSECGCVHAESGRYLSAEESFVNENCTEECSCTEGVVQCEPLSGCADNAECSLRDGQRSCYCLDGYDGDGYNSCTSAPGVCIVWGDPHYITFDGNAFDFQGDCEYSLVEVCFATSLPYFHLIGGNAKNTPAENLSYLRELRFEYQNDTFEIRTSDDIRLNGETIPIPFSTTTGVTIRYTYPNLFLEVSDIGLSVRYDGTNAEIRLNPDYSGLVCGLCGNYDKNVTNDFLLPGGQQAADENEFGDSFAIGQNCNMTETTEPCDSESSSKAEDLCSIIVDPQGPFGGCHDYIMPDGYFDACIYDLCHTLPVEDNLCYNIETYAQLCRFKGGVPEDWRSSTSQCPFVCDADKNYNYCTSACQPSCLEPSGKSDCPYQCVESCVCPDGLLLDNNQCVSPIDCSCFYEEGGFYIDAGETFTNDNCTEECSCEFGYLECQSLPGCGKNAECIELDGEKDCYCLEGYDVGNGIAGCERAPGVCIVWGDPHYVTFDGNAFAFQGDCEYSLVQVCSATSLPYFHLIGGNTKNIKNDAVSFLTELRFEYDGDIYELGTNTEARVNGETITLPFHSPSGVAVMLSFPHLILTTSSGIFIRFDGRNARVKLSGEYSGLVCGLCGNFDYNITNDFVLNGQEITDLNVFGDSFKTRDDCEVPESVNCNDNAKLMQAESLCSVITDESGPFASCHEIVDPSQYYDACVYDLCQTLPDEIVLCDSVDGYAQACAYKQIVAENWRATVTQCPFTCDYPQQYDACASACQPSCVEPDGRSDCPFTCLESCVCPPGLLLEGTNCINQSNCGCFHESSGRYLQTGESFVTDDCNQECVCNVTSSLVCQPLPGCVDNAQCSFKEGLKTCYCMDGYVGDGFVWCNEENNLYCVVSNPTTSRKKRQRVQLSSLPFSNKLPVSTINRYAVTGPFKGTEVYAQERAFNAIKVNGFRLRTFVSRKKRDVKFGAFGAFGCSHDNVEAVVMVQDFSGLRARRFTYTVNKGDDLTPRLSIKQDLRSRIVWRHGNRNMRPSLKSTSGNIDFGKASSRNTGLWEVYRKRRYYKTQHPLFRIILRDCPSGKNGFQCKSRTCPCENGGMCDDKSDKCICVPGFSGEFCQIACPYGSVGPGCTWSCAEYFGEDYADCTNLLFCLPDPFGCRCYKDLPQPLCKAKRQECPKGFKQFRLSCYKSINKLVTHDAARNICQKLGAGLVSIEDEEENAFVSKISKSQKAWIGGYREQDSPSFMWYDNAVFLYTNWRTSEPNAPITMPVCMETNFVRAGLWNDHACNDDERLNYAVCETKL